ncbi:MAG: DUF554 domain-containing protein [Verrucomicrobiae bacterium]|nr:DUF554 domain-containing protein [Verrucomicrobiae bacterium]
MVGTIANAVGIVLGGAVGFLRKNHLASATERWLKLVVGLLTAYVGLRLTWASLQGTVGQMLQQLGITLVGMILGKLVGRVLRLQKLSNALGRFARCEIEGVPSGAARFADGFKTCTVLFCAAPLSILGSVQDGLSAYSAPLLLKAVVDGFTASALARQLGWGVVVSAVPVLAWQGTITLIARAAAPWLEAHELVGSVHATGGLLVFSVALVMLGLKRIALAEYLPALAFAPLLTVLLM